MIAHHVLRAVASAASPISLAEVMRAAELQTRVDRKYLVPATMFDVLGGELAATHQALEIRGRRLFRYESTYFDTPDLRCYRDHVQNRRLRFKARTREYLDSGDCQFEVKLEGRRDGTVKHRTAHPPIRHGMLTADAMSFLRDALARSGFCRAPATLGPMLTTGYLRATFVDPASGRVTCDVSLRCWDGLRKVRSRPDHVLVETKSAGAAGHFDRTLWTLGARPVSISKYCVGLAALRPDLPSNRWHRVLHQQF